MTTPESDVKQYFKRRLLSIVLAADVYCRYSTRGAGEFGRGGEPDADINLDGVYFFIEAKAPGKKVDPNSRQGLRIQQMRDGGEIVFEISGREGVDHFFNNDFLTDVVSVAKHSALLRRETTKLNAREQKRQQQRTMKKPEIPKR